MNKLIKSVRLIATFYRGFMGAGLGTTLFCSFILWRFRIGHHIFFFVFWFKMITMALIFYFIRLYKQHEFYYYRNLGVSKKILWISALSFDFVLFITILVITYNLG